MHLPLSVVLLSVFFVFGAQCITCTWTEGGRRRSETYDWTDASNWSPQVPGSDDWAIIPPVSCSSSGNTDVHADIDPVHLPIGGGGGGGSETTENTRYILAPDGISVGNLTVHRGNFVNTSSLTVSDTLHFSPNWWRDTWRSERCEHSEISWGAGVGDGWSVGKFIFTAGSLIYYGSESPPVPFIVDALEIEGSHSKILDGIALKYNSIVGGEEIVGGVEHPEIVGGSPALTLRNSAVICTNEN